MTDVPRWRRRVVSLCLVAVVILGGAVASLGGDPNVCYAVADAGNRLVSINKTTGANTVIGQTGAENIEAIAFQPGGDVLYAADSGQLGTLNLSTGAFAATSSPIGSGGGSDGVVTFDEVDGLTFDPSNGVLYGSVNRPGADLLIQINPSTGARIADAFGPGQDYVVIDGPSFHDTIDDIAIDPLDGQMYGINNTGGSGSDQVVRINKSTGAGTVVGPTGVEDMGGLGFFNDGTLYGSTGLSGPVSQRDRLWTISKSSGTAVLAHSFTEHSDYEALDCLTASLNTISGTVFEDNNANGVFDSGDFGRSGVTVSLYADNNGDGLVDASDNLIETSDSNASGQFVFSLATAGDFVMQIDPADLPSGSVMTTDNVEVANFTFFGESDSGNQFGSAVNDPPTPADDSTSTGSGTPVTIPVLENDSDPEGQALTVTAVQSPSNGTAVVNADNTITYTPAIGFVGTDSFDYTVADSDGATATATVTVTVGEFTIRKTDSPDPVNAGQQVTFVISVTNSGLLVQDNVTVTDTLPSGFTAASVSSSQGACASLPCNLGTFLPGGTATVTLVADVAPGVGAGLYHDTATVQSDLVSPLSFTEATRVNELATLSIAKTDSPDPVDAGESVTYTVTVENSGPSNADNVTVTDTLPAGFSISSISFSQGGCSALPCNLGTLSPGASATVVIDAQVGAGVPAGSYTNTATATSDEAAPVSVDETTQVNELAVLSIAKTDSPDPVDAGESVTYTVTVENSGPSNADNVTVTDTLPAGFSISSVSSSQGGCANMPCNLGTIAPNSTASVTIVSDIASSTNPGTYTNLAATESDEAGPVSVTEDTSVIRSADLRVTKVDDPDPITAGSQLTYTVSASNDGPSDATSVVVEDTLPDGTTFVSISPSSGCTISGRTITCAVGSMSSGASLTWTITVMVDKAGADIEDGDTLENIAEIRGGDSDPNSSNNEDVESTGVIAPNLVLSKGAVPPEGSEVSPGEQLSFTINYSNSGSAPATDVEVTDAVHSALGDINPSAGGVFDPETRRIKWNLGTVAPGSAGSVSFTARVGASLRRETITNQGCTTASELLFTICSNTTEHTLEVPDVLLVKGADRAETSEVRAFDAVTYSLTITNLRGGGRALGVVVTDTPPPHMSYVPGTTRVDGTLVGDSGATSPLFVGGLSIEPMAQGETRSITFQMLVDSGAPAGALLQNWGYVTWNVGTVSSGDFFDLRVLRPRSGPSLRQTILVEGPAGQITFVTVFRQVLNLLPVTGYQSLVLAVLALSALGLGTSLSSSVSPNLLRALGERPQRDRRGSAGREEG